MLCGCFGLYLGSMALFALGVSLTPWHGCLFIAGALGGGWLACEGDRAKRWQKSAGVTGACLVLCGLLALIASRFDELTYDGMWARIEPVINLVAGWNPIRDPGFSERSTVQDKFPFVRDGHNYQPAAGTILAGYLACLTGEVNAGKAVTPILGLAAFGVAFGGLASMAIPVGWAVALAALAALNPVILYQSSSYYVDGHVAALFTAGLFLGVRTLMMPAGKLEKWLFFISLGFLAAAKTSGIFYGLALLLLVGAIWVLSRPQKILALAFAGAALTLTLTLLYLLRNQGGFSAISQSYIKEASSYATGSHSFGTWAPGLGAGVQPSRLEVFLRSHFAGTQALAEEPVFLKFPFWLNRRELAVFEDLSPQPYIGGFGPLYGAFFILSALCLLLIRQRPPLVAWLPLAASFGSIYFSQLWWARWTPQAWLIPLGFILPVVCSFQGQPPEKKWVLPFLAVFTGLLNSILILAFYTNGCIKSQFTLESQLAYLKILPQPLSVFMPRFHGNRIFFIREGLEYRKLDSLPHPPWIKLHRTDTLVVLPAGTDPQTQVDPAVWKNWKKRKLVEL